MKTKFAITLYCLVLTACANAPSTNDAPQVSPATTPEAAGLVDITQLVPDIDLDIRYAGTHNFTGRRVDGYELRDGMAALHAAAGTIA